MSENKLIEEIQRYQRDAKKYRKLYEGAEDCAVDRHKALYALRGWKPGAVVVCRDGTKGVINSINLWTNADPLDEDRPPFSYKKFKKDGELGARVFNAWRSEVWSLTGDHHD